MVDEWTTKIIIAIFQTQVNFGAPILTVEGHKLKISVTTAAGVDVIEFWRQK